MGNLDRRTLLRAAAVSVLAASTKPASVAFADTGAGPAHGPNPPGRAPSTATVVTRLPGEGNQLALTIDDGTNTAVVATLAQLCRDSGVRLTFFPNGVNPSWTVNAGLLRPMVDSGQIQLGNHTWSHPKLTQLSKSSVAEQIQRNADFLRNTYGTDGTPYFRPPYGLRNADTDAVAADLGYSTITLWSGTIGDSKPENEDQLLGNARVSFGPQQIILGHANLPPIIHTYAQILDIIHSRGLQTVTLADAFG